MKKDNKFENRKLEQFLRDQEFLDTLRFITCGSVDDGKSTLIGRLLFEADLIYEDQLESLTKFNKNNSNKMENLDFSILLDGLDAEREQGITIDVAYRFFKTLKRKFIVADTPGHEQYTSNMATGASTADLAIILVDASKGLQTQTRRHSIICSLLGVKNIILAINKMDLVNYNKEIFLSVRDEFQELANNLNFEHIEAIPLSGLTGENVVKKSELIDWYKGSSLLEYLENVSFHHSKIRGSLRLPVQLVNRPNANFRGYSGTIERGSVSQGQKIKVLPSGESATVNDVFLYKSSLQNAVAGQSITIILDKEIDISRGDVITPFEDPCEISDHLEAKLIWMKRETGFQGRALKIKLGSSLVNAHITEIKSVLDLNTCKNLAASKLEFNEIGDVTIKLDKPIAFENFYDCKGLGSFILIDRFSNDTLAAGLVKFGLRRAKNIHTQNFDLNKNTRRQLNNHSSLVVWFTGISGSGKSTIANAFEKRLFANGVRTFLLDGDNLRQGINNNLGFSDEDRIENVRRVSEISKLMVEAGIVTIVSLISPFKSDRDFARNLFGKNEFFEVFVNTPLSEAEKRDPKGLYKKARSGEIPNLTGIGSAYEKPDFPDVTLLTLDYSVEESVDILFSKIYPFIDRKTSSSN